MTTDSSQDWSATLIAYANGTLDAADRERVATALAQSPELRAELAEVELLRAAVRIGTPPATVPDSVWARIDAPAPLPLPPPAAPPIAQPVTPLDPGRSRPRRTPWLLAAAATVTALAVAGAVVLTRDDEGTQANPNTTSASNPTAQPAPGDSPLSDPPAVALRNASLAMVSARTAMFDVTGQGTVRLEGILGRDSIDAEVGIELRGEAAVVFGEDTADYRFSTEFEGVSGPATLRPPPATSEIVVVDGVQYESDDGAPFETSDPDEGSEGLFSQIVIRPDLLGRLPEIAQGEIEDLGLGEQNGIEVRRLAFQLAPGTIGSESSEDMVEVWIAPDGSVQRVRFDSSGEIELAEADRATLELHVDIALTEFGEPLEIDAPT